MIRSLNFLALILCACTAVCATEPRQNSLSPEEISEGWILLFDGDSLFGWAPRGPAEWVVSEGAVRCPPGKGSGFLSSTTEFADFELRLDFRADEKAATGIFLRSPVTGDITS
jgi:hypothetical protein